MFSFFFQNLLMEALKNKWSLAEKRLSVVEIDVKVVGPFLLLN